MGERVFVELVLQPERRPREVEFPLVVVFLVKLSVHWRLFLLERSMGQFLSRWTRISNARFLSAFFLYFFWLLVQSWRLLWLFLRCGLSIEFLNRLLFSCFYLISISLSPSFLGRYFRQLFGSLAPTSLLRAFLLRSVTLTISLFKRWHFSRVIWWGNTVWILGRTSYFNVIRLNIL